MKIDSYTNKNYSWFDYLCWFAITLCVGYVIYTGLDPLSLGGVILVGGAYFTYKGKILYAVLVYLFADFCWVWNAYITGNYQGTFFIILGMTLGILATFKMKLGKMSSKLEHYN